MLLGCIADDFTGAADLANNLVRSGMRTVQTIGVPEGELAGDVDGGPTEQRAMPVGTRRNALVEVPHRALQRGFERRVRVLQRQRGEREVGVVAGARVALHDLIEASKERRSVVGDLAPERRDGRSHRATPSRATRSTNVGCARSRSTRSTSASKSSVSSARAKK